MYTYGSQHSAYSPNHVYKCVKGCLVQIGWLKISVSDLVFNNV